MVIQKELILPDNVCPADTPEQFEHSIFFDIETTGLSWRTSHLYLIGAAFIEKGHWILRQWFLQKPHEEKELLEQFSTFLSGFSQVIHYNGQSFDIPYLLHKYQFYQLPDPFAAAQSLDLYQTVRPFRELLHLPSLKQKEIETLLHITREDPYSGGELINCYQEYLKSGSDELLQRLLLHNHDDVCGLLGIYPMTACTALFKGEFTVLEPTLDGTRLRLPLRLSAKLPLPLYVSGELCRLEALGNCAELIVNGTEETLRHFYKNYRDYYYLPMEDEAIHKSIAVYVDTAHRQKACPSNCYRKVTGLFFPQPKPRFQPDFYRSHGEKPAYFLLDQNWPDNMETLKDYVCDLLSLL